jgi:hypothetical protein
MVFTSIGGLIGLALLLGGIAVMLAYAFGREDDGYFNSDRKQRHSSTHAITTEEIDLGEADWTPDQILGDVQIQVESGRAVFVGLGPDEDVDRYLADAVHDELTGFDGDDPEFSLHPAQRRRRHRSSRTSAPPGPRAPASRPSPGTPSSVVGPRW